MKHFLTWILLLSSLAVADTSTVFVPSFGDKHWKATVATFAGFPMTGNSVGDVRYAVNTKNIYAWDGSTWNNLSGGGGGSGDVVGPGSSVLYDLPMFADTTGKLLSDSLIRSNPSGFLGIGGVDPQSTLHTGAAGNVTSGTVDPTAIILGGINSTANVAAGCLVSGGSDVGNTCTGPNSLVLGGANVVAGYASVALGDTNDVEGARSIAIGEELVLSGAESAAIGNTITMGGSDTAAIGTNMTLPNSGNSLIIGTAHVDGDNGMSNGIVAGAGNIPNGDTSFFFGTKLGKSDAFHHGCFLMSGTSGNFTDCDEDSQLKMRFNSLKMVQGGTGDYLDGKTFFEVDNNGNGTFNASVNAPLGSFIGNSDAVELQVTGNSTQTGPILQVQNSAATSALTMGDTGNVVLTNSAASYAFGSTTPALWFKSGDSVRPAITWDAQADTMGFYFYSRRISDGNYTPVAHIQDNGSMVATQFHTDGNFLMYDYRIDRGGGSSIQWGDSSTAALTFSTGFASGTTYQTVGNFLIQDPATPGLWITGAASQTADYLNIKTSGGSSLFKVDGSGVVTVAGSQVALKGASESYIQVSSGLLSSVNVSSAIFLQSGKTTRAQTIEFIQGIASTFSVCTTNPTLTLYDCGTSSACGSPSTLAAVTITAGATITDGTISSATIPAGHYWAWALTAGVCTSLSASATAQVTM